jgi:hypothetical protein
MASASPWSCRADSPSCRRLRGEGPVALAPAWAARVGQSRLNRWPVNGRTHYASPFGRELQTEAWQSVIDAASSAP